MGALGIVLKQRIPLHSVIPYCWDREKFAIHWNHTILKNRLCICLCWVLVMACKIFIASYAFFHCAHGLFSHGTWPGTWASFPCSIWDLTSLTRDWTHVPCIARWGIHIWLLQYVGCTNALYFSTLETCILLWSQIV